MRADKTTRAALSQRGSVFCIYRVVKTFAAKLVILLENKNIVINFATSYKKRHSKDKDIAPSR